MRQDGFPRYIPVHQDNPGTGLSEQYAALLEVVGQPAIAPSTSHGFTLLAVCRKSPICGYW